MSDWTKHLVLPLIVGVIVTLVGAIVTFRPRPGMEPPAHVPSVSGLTEEQDIEARRELAREFEEAGIEIREQE